MGPPGPCQARVEASAHPRDSCVLLKHMHGDGAAIEERHRHRHLHHGKHCLPACCALGDSHIQEGNCVASVLCGQCLTWMPRTYTPRGKWNWKTAIAKQSLYQGAKQTLGMHAGLPQQWT